MSLEPGPVIHSPCWARLFLTELVRAASPPTAETVSLRQIMFCGIWSRRRKSFDGLLYCVNSVVFAVKVKYEHNRVKSFVAVSLARE